MKSSWRSRLPLGRRPPGAPRRSAAPVAVDHLDPLRGCRGGRADDAVLEGDELRGARHGQARGAGGTRWWGAARPPPGGSCTRPSATTAATRSRTSARVRSSSRAICLGAKIGSSSLRKLRCSGGSICSGMSGRTCPMATASKPEREHLGVVEHLAHLGLACRRCASPCPPCATTGDGVAQQLVHRLRVGQGLQVDVLRRVDERHGRNLTPASGRVGGPHGGLLGGDDRRGRPSTTGCRPRAWRPASRRRGPRPSASG